MAGDDAIGAPMLAVQSGVHDVGEPLQLVLPPASYTVRFPSVDPTYSRLFEAAGDAVTAPPVVAVQSGAHEVGEPLQLVTPFASNAYSLPSLEPTYTVPASY